MLNSEISNFVFTPNYKDSCDSFNELKNLLHTNDEILNDSSYLIHNRIKELRNRVLLKSEQLKTRIEVITQELLDDLTEYEKICTNHHKQSSNPSFLALRDQFKSQTDAAKKSCNEWSIELSELKFEEAKWKKIKVECEKTFTELCETKKQLENELLVQRFESKEENVDFFEKIHINSALKKKVKKLRKIYFS